MLGSALAVGRANEAHKPVCTDISRREVVPCPGEQDQGAIAKPVDRRSSAGHEEKTGAAREENSNPDTTSNSAPTHVNAAHQPAAPRGSEADKSAPESHVGKPIMTDGEIVSAPPD